MEGFRSSQPPERITQPETSSTHDIVMVRPTRRNRQIPNSKGPRRASDAAHRAVIILPDNGTYTPSDIVWDRIHQLALIALGVDLN